MGGTIAEILKLVLTLYYEDQKQKGKTAEEIKVMLASEIDEYLKNRPDLIPDV